MTPLYIFDLDGTLALIEHRRHYVTGGRKDWDAFHAACVDDVPNWPVLRILGLMIDEGFDVWIWSGRDDSVRGLTHDWLSDVAMLPVLELCMRPHGDHRLDVDLKRGWLRAMHPDDRDRLQAVFDDRDRLVQMWREEGVPCFQVAPGDF